MLLSLNLIGLINLPSLIRASGMEIHLQPAKNVETMGSICPAKTLFPLHHDQDHSDSNLCLQKTHSDESNVKYAQWTFDPICKSLSNGTFCVYANSSFANGRGIIFITTSEVAKEVAKLPAFASHQDMTTSGPPPFEVQPVPARGLGVIANTTIERGDQVMMFQPLVAVHGEAFQAPGDSDFAFFNSALHYLPNASLALYTSLVAHSQRSDVNWERLNTNAFSEEFGGQEHFIVLPETARMNHDCRPNAIWYFDHETLTHHVHASRRIYAGEEITISYTDPVQTRKKQASTLKHSWGFDCTCSLCKASPDAIVESNRRIETILKLTAELEDFGPESSAIPEGGELLISLYELERLYAEIADAYMLTSMAYNAVGNDWKTVEYAMKALEASLIHYGPKSQEFKRAKHLMLSPRSHESWMMRRNAD